MKNPIFYMLIIGAAVVAIRIFERQGAEFEKYRSRSESPMFTLASDEPMDDYTSEEEDALEKLLRGE